MNPPRIFISYSSQDRKIVKKVHRQLTDACYDVRIDKNRLENSNWSRDIAEALVECDMLCLMWSRSAMESEWVKHEWLTARALEKRIIPCILPGAPPLPKPLFNQRGVIIENARKAGKQLINHLMQITDFNERYDYTILPQNSYIPFNPNPDFTGRQRDLLELYLSLIGNLNKIGINLVGTVGMGGVGKTQLVVEFAYRFSFAFTSVHWIQAADTSQWLSEFVKLAIRLVKIPIDPYLRLEIDSLVRHKFINPLQEYCKNNPQTLIILDDVPDPAKLNNDSDLPGFTPLSLGCNLLFTTRKQFYLPGVTYKKVSMLPPAGAYSLLTTERQPNNQEETQHAREICNAVGYLPLALVLINGYLRKYNSESFAGYHRKLLRNKLGIIDIGEVSQEELATRHKAAVGLTIKEDWKKLSDKLARQLFLLAGQFNEGAIIRTYYLSLMAGIQFDKDITPSPLEKAFNLLYELNIMEKVDNHIRAIRLHPLVREFANTLVPVEEQSAFKAQAANLLATDYVEFRRLNGEKHTHGIFEIWDTINLIQNWGGTVNISIRNIQSLLRFSAKTLPIYPRLKPILITLIPQDNSYMSKLEGHCGSVNSVVLSSDCKWMVSGSNDGTIKVWDIMHSLDMDIENGKTPGHIKGHNGGIWYVSSAEKGLMIWDVANWEALHTLECHRRGVTSVALSADGKQALSGSDDKSLKLWDIENGKILRTLKGHSDSVTSVALSADGKWALSGSSDKTLKVWDLNSGEALHTIQGHSGPVLTVALSADGKRALSGSDDYTLKVWDLESGKALCTLKGHHGSVKSVTLSTNGKQALSGSNDHTLKVWDLESGEALRTLKGHRGSVSTVALSADGKRALSGSDDRTLKIWDLESGKTLVQFTGESAICCCALTVDCKNIVSGEVSGRMYLLQLEGMN